VSSPKPAPPASGPIIPPPTFHHIKNSWYSVRMQEKELPDVLTKELKEKIKTLHDKGLDRDAIAVSLDMPREHLKMLFMQERQEELLKKAEMTSDMILSIDLNSPDIRIKYSKEKIQLLKLIQAEAQFIRESLGKDQGYSKRTELTGANGKEIKIAQITFTAPVAPAPRPVNA
jgi:hypothetical protein